MTSPQPGATASDSERSPCNGSTRQSKPTATRMDTQNRTNPALVAPVTSGQETDYAKMVKQMTGEFCLLSTEQRGIGSDRICYRRQ